MSGATRERCPHCHQAITPAARKMAADLDYYKEHLGRLTVATMARRTGRTPKAVRRLLERHRVGPTRDGDYLTAAEAAVVLGLSPQAVAARCRRGTLKAHRNPGGRWWQIPSARVYALADKEQR